MIDVEGGRVWYRIHGSGPGVPLLALHGGPGLSSDCLASLAELGDDRPVILYDQLGGGRSDRPADPALWSVNRFVNEVEVVRTYLRLPALHLVGHSWGGLLALEYARRGYPVLRSLVLVSAPISIRRYLDAMRRLRAALPPDVRQALDAHEAAGTTTSDEYANGVMAYRSRHLLRTTPWPREVHTWISQIGVDVYTALWGTDSFSSTGLLKDYDGTEKLSELRVPVLFATGRYCAVTPDDMLDYASRTPAARAVIFENSSHFPMIEESRAFIETVRAFVTAHDAPV